MTVHPGVPVRRRLIAVLVMILGPAEVGAQGLPEWLTVDTAGRTVGLTLQAEAGGPGGIATLNGLHHGLAQLVVPLNWTVKWTWSTGTACSPTAWW